MSSAQADPVGDLTTALAHASRLMQANPALAAEQAREILKALPGQPGATLLLAASHRARGKFDEARALAAPLSRAHPDWAEASHELALALVGLGDEEGAIVALRAAVAAKPLLAEAWRLLGDRLTLAGDLSGADDAYAQSIKAATSDPRLMKAAIALCDNDIAVAEHTLRAHLKAQPTDVAAIRMFAEVASRLGRYGDAEKLLQRCLELAPSFTGARHNYAIVLYRANKPLESLPQIELLLRQEPNNANYQALKAAALSRLSEYEGAIGLYESVLAQHPEQPTVWMSYGHVLKTANRTEESIAAYRRATAQAPHFGEGWWSLANLKTFAFTDADIATMERALTKTDLAQDDCFHLHYALGKALEDRRAYADSFAHYAQGAKLRSATLHYESSETTEHVRRSKALFTPALFVAHAGGGDPAPDPIFIVGLPRSGSTLIEQILSSHSAVEGTIELPDIGMLAKRIGGKRKRGELSNYPEILSRMSTEDLRQLGRDYLGGTRAHRKTNRPIFIDKMPNNFAHVGLIHLILPNARIIDARRHPMATCFSAFKQHFARGQGFTYDFNDLGRYYRDYVELMAHYDEALPGRVHRVFYEQMVADTEAEVRSLLNYCGLAFEPACLRFYENQRAVRTASSEQVRQPIFTDAVEHWRHFEPWLDPLKQALGDVLTAYPEAPEFLDTTESAGN